MRNKKTRLVINPDELIKRIEKEINKEIIIKVPVKGVKVDFGGGEDWSWIWGLMVVGLILILGIVIRQKDKTIRQLIEEKNRIEMTPVIATPAIEPTPTVVLTPTPTMRLRYRR